MKVTGTVDDSGLQASLKNIKLNSSDMLSIEGAGARAQINGQRNRVPVDTAATQNSIKSHIVDASNTQVDDEIGPETVYAPNIEYGRKDQPNYPIQPFVRPTVEEDFNNTINAMETQFGGRIQASWK
jgi:hypothetical protein